MFRSQIVLLLAACVVVFVFQLSKPLSLSAAPRTAPAKSVRPTTDYACALATVDRFLQAWQAENGLVLLTGRAKERVSREEIEAFFSASAPAAYEIARGKPLRPGRYEFPVMLLGSPFPASTSKERHVRRRFSNIVVLRTGNNDWAIDKLP
jgi:hypothetical protein